MIASLAGCAGVCLSCNLVRKQMQGMLVHPHKLRTLSLVSSASTRFCSATMKLSSPICELIAFDNSTCRQEWTQT